MRIKKILFSQIRNKFPAQCVAKSSRGKNEHKCTKAIQGYVKVENILNTIQCRFTNENQISDFHLETFALIFLFIWLIISIGIFTQYCPNLIFGQNLFNRSSIACRLVCQAVCCLVLLRWVQYIQTQVYDP